MPNPAIFYPDPPPQPPQRFAPIPAQGQQPRPLRPDNVAALVVGCWPTGVEYQPYQRQTTAPIPAQGQQPRPRLDVTSGTVRLAWEPPDPQPPRPIPTVPIPVQGDLPPRWSAAPLTNLIAAWTPPDPPPVQRPLTAAPLSLTYGDLPPRVAAALVRVLACIRAWDPPDPPPTQRAVTLPVRAQGDQPPRQRQMPSYWLWLGDPPAPQQPEQVAAVTPPPVVTAQPPFVRMADAILPAWQADVATQRRAPGVPVPTPGDTPPRWSAGPLAGLVGLWAPPDPAPAQRPLIVAPLALAYGDLPPRWSVAPLANLLGAWVPPDPMPVQRPLALAPLTFAYGQRPPLNESLAAVQYLAGWPTGLEYEPVQRVRRVPVPTPGDQPPRARWPVPAAEWFADPTRTTTPVAAPIPPPVAAAQPPYGRLPESILIAWQPADPTRTRQVVAPMAAQGQQPPRWGVAQALALVAAWTPPDWPAQGGCRTRIVSVDAPPPRPAALRAVLDSWIAADLASQRPARLVPVAAARPPVGRPVTLWIIRGWWDRPDHYPYPSRPAGIFPFVPGVTPRIIDLIDFPGTLADLIRLADRAIDRADLPGVIADLVRLADRATDRVNLADAASDRVDL